LDIIAPKSEWLRQMFRKYAWYKNFGCAVDIDNLPYDEVDTIMLINSEYNNKQEELNKLNK